MLNRITFSGTGECGGFSKQAFEERFTNSSIDRVKQLKRVVDHTTITNLDYQEVIETACDDCFLFLDPPYFSSSKSALYGKNGKLHRNFDHVRFSKVMKNCKCNWLITYDDSMYIKKLFYFAHTYSWDLKYGMRNVTKNSDQCGKELFISNYLIEN